MVAKHIFHVHGLGNHILSHRAARIVLDDFAAFQLKVAANEQDRLAVDGGFDALAVPIINEVRRVVCSIDARHRHNTILGIIAHFELLSNRLSIDDGMHQTMGLVAVGIVIIRIRVSADGRAGHGEDRFSGEENLWSQSRQGRSLMPSELGKDYFINEI